VTPGGAAPEEVFFHDSLKVVAAFPLVELGPWRRGDARRRSFQGGARAGVDWKFFITLKGMLPKAEGRLTKFGVRV